MRRLLWGAAAIAVYVTAALVVADDGRVVPRPLYDGLAPAAPYRFVSPPPDLAGDNEQPEPGTGVVDLVGKEGSAPTSISTGDGQLQVVLQEGTFAAKEKEKAVEVALTPLVAPPPLDIGGGLKIEGNAYRVDAKYAKSGDAAEAQRELTVVLRFPNNASVMVRRDGRSWTRLGTQISAASLQLFAATDRLGTFAGAGKPHRTWTRWIPYGAGGLGVIAGIVGYLSGRRGWFRRSRDRKGARDRPKKAAPPRGKRKPGRQV
jgi:hypothetical protein